MPLHTGATPCITGGAKATADLPASTAACPTPAIGLGRLHPAVAAGASTAHQLILHPPAPPPAASQPRPRSQAYRSPAARCPTAAPATAPVAALRSPKGLPPGRRLRPHARTCAPAAAAPRRPPAAPRPGEFSIVSPGRLGRLLRSRPPRRPRPTRGARPIAARPGAPPCCRGCTVRVHQDVAPAGSAVTAGLLASAALGPRAAPAPPSPAFAPVPLRGSGQRDSGGDAMNARRTSTDKGCTGGLVRCGDG